MVEIYSHINNIKDIYIENIPNMLSYILLYSYTNYPIKLKIGKNFLLYLEINENPLGKEK